MPVTWVDVVIYATVIAYVVVAAANVGASVMPEKVSADRAETVAAAVRVIVNV